MNKEVKTYAITYDELFKILVRDEYNKTNTIIDKLIGKAKPELSTLGLARFEFVIKLEDGSTLDEGQNLLFAWTDEDHITYTVTDDNIEDINHSNYLHEPIRKIPIDLLDLDISEIEVPSLRTDPILKLHVPFIDYLKTEYGDSITIPQLLCDVYIQRNGIVLEILEDYNVTLNEMKLAYDNGFNIFKHNIPSNYVNGRFTHLVKAYQYDLFAATMYYDIKFIKFLYKRDDINLLDENISQHDILYSFTNNHFECAKLFEKIIKTDDEYWDKLFVMRVRNKDLEYIEDLVKEHGEEYVVNLFTKLNKEIMLSFACDIDYIDYLQEIGFNDFTDEFKKITNILLIKNNKSIIF